MTVEFNRQIAYYLRWRFAESLVNWNGTIQTLEHLQTNKQTDTETDADEISTASLRGGNNAYCIIFNEFT